MRYFIIIFNFIEIIFNILSLFFADTNETKLKVFSSKIELHLTKTIVKKY